MVDGKLSRYVALSCEAEAVLKKLLQLHNRPVAEVARKEGGPAQTKYNWCSKARSEELPMAGKRSSETHICLRTYRRWFYAGKVHEDIRPTAFRPNPASKLSDKERQ